MAAMPAMHEQEQFLRAVFGKESGYLFISTNDRDEPDQKKKWVDRSFVYPLQMAEALAYVKERDEAGRDVYVAAQLYKEPNRRQKNFVKTCPSAWADLDTACPWGTDPEPSVVLETSPGRWHGFWRTPRPMPPHDAEELSRQIAYAHHRAGADLGGWDLTQVLRIPGTHNHKYPDAPVVLLKRCDQEPIPWEAFKRLPAAPSRRDDSVDGSHDDDPPVPLEGFDLENWQKEAVPDRSAWAMHMVAILKDHGLADRLVEVALANHPIYLAKAREKWGNKESLIYDDIRRCIKHWRDHPTPILDMSLLRTPADEAPQAAPGSPPTGALRYPIQTLAQLAAMEQDEITQIVEGILWGRRTHWVFSDPNSGKTLFLLTILMHVAAGRDFLGRPTQQTPVLLIEEDSPFSVIAEYVEMLSDIYEIDLETIPFYVNKSQGLRIVNAEARQSVVDAINACPQRPGVILLDAAERLVPSDRFNTKELDELTLLLQWMLNEQITPIVIDHTNRARVEKGKEKEFKANPMERLFGARAKSAITDVMLYFDGFLKIGPVEVIFAKFRGQLPSGFSMTFDASEGFILTDHPSAAVSDTERRVMRFLNSAERDWYSVGTITTFVNEGRRGKEKELKERTVRRAAQGLATRRWLLTQGETQQREYRLNAATPGLFQ